MIDNIALDSLLRRAQSSDVSDHVIEPSAAEQTTDGDIAIIGVHARVGETESARELWDAVNAGTDLIRPFPEHRRHDAQQLCRSLLGTDLGEPVPYAYVEDVAGFDPQRYGISVPEAELMDPHQRLFLSSCMSALDDAGYGGSALRGSATGVYAASGLIPGLYLSGYEAEDGAAAGMGTSGGLSSVVASRISHLLDLTGPALVVDTACSSSMAALVLACRDLRSGRVETALAGGVRLTLVPRRTDDDSFGIEAESHRTRTFSADADGTGGGEGCIAMLLKPLAAALHDGDHVYGVIKGAAMNQDGETTGITAPSADAQADVIRAAWKDAGVEPETITYIEAHGTATELGDPVEIDGLTKAFTRYTDRRQICAVGTVKSNAGHLDTAAGIAGVLKVLGMFADRVIPPSLHFTAPNPEIDFVESPVYVADALQPWQPEGPRRAGVSSFGMSGTNAHLVLEEAPAAASAEPAAASAEPAAQPRAELVTVTAHSAAALQLTLSRLHTTLIRRQRRPALRDIAFTLGTGRTIGHHRFAAVVTTADELIETIGDHLAGRENAALTGTADPRGQGRCPDAAQLSGPDREQELRRCAARFVTGAELDWPAVFAGTAPRRVPLPPTGEIPVRTWRPETEAPIQVTGFADSDFAPHPLVHRHQFNGPGIDVYESDFSAATTFELGEHVVDGSCVLVGTAFLEMVCAVARQTLGESIVIENMHYLDPLITWADETRRVQLVIDWEDTGEQAFGFLIRSCERGRDDWAEHARGRVARHTSAAETGDRLDIAALIAEFRPADEPLIYQRELVQTAGRYWNSSQQVRFAEDSRALLHFSADAPTRRKKAEYSLFPPIMDSSINLSLFIEDEAFLPMALGRGEIYGPQPDAGYSLMIPDARAELAETPVRTSQVIMCDEQGQVFARFDNYTVGKLSDPGKFRRSGAVAHLHQLEWTALQPQPAAEESAAVHCAIIRGSQWTEAEAERWAQQVKDSGAAHVAQVLPEGSADALEQLHGLFAVVRALVRQPWPGGLTYTLVTIGGQQVETGEQVDPAAHAAAAFVNALAGENSQVRVRVIDTDETCDDDAIRALLQRIDSLPAPRMLAVRSGRLSSQRIAPLPEGAPAAQQALSAEAGAVLITGGTGGMGLALAARLVRSRPDCHPVLINRHLDGPVLDHHDERVRAWFGELSESERARIRFVRADVTDLAAMRQAVAAARRIGGRISGLVHAAGLPGDGFLMSKDWETFSAVLAPKISGIDTVLESFDGELPPAIVLCSTLTSVFGAPGQSDYAAANGYLDGLALRLRAEGIPAVSLNWTGWAESGMAHRHGIDGAGYRTEFVDDETGARWLDESPGTSAGQLLVGRFVPAVVESERAELEEVLDIAAVLPDSAPGPAPGKPPASRRTDLIPFDTLEVRGLKSAEPSEIERAVLEAWATTLGVSEIDIDQPFFEAGGNSLLASRLQTLLDDAFPGAVSILDLFVSDSAGKLIEHIAEATGAAHDSAPPAPAAHRQDQSAGDAAAADRLSAMLDDFIDGKVDVDEVLNRHSAETTHTTTETDPYTSRGHGS